MHIVKSVLSDRRAEGMGCTPHVNPLNSHTQKLPLHPWGWLISPNLLSYKIQYLKIICGWTVRHSFISAQACVQTANEGIDSLLTSHSHWRWRVSPICFNINSVGIGFDGAQDVCLAKTDTRPNPTQHAFAYYGAIHARLSLMPLLNQRKSITLKLYPPSLFLHTFL